MNKLHSLHHSFQSDKQSAKVFPFDLWLVFAALALLLLGWIMVTSASIEVAMSQTHQPLYFSIRHGVYVCLSLLLAICVRYIPLTWWRQFGPWLLMMALFLLTAVLFLGREVNGARRWLSLGIINIQVSELAKLCLIIYLSGYLIRRLDLVRNSWRGFIIPLLITALLASLLILEPDYGATVVMLAICMGMLLLAGAPFWRFLVFGIFVTIIGVVGAFAEPYRLQRITSYLDPWANQFDSGYQLTQALIAFGRGSWNGLGLGNSVQKLFYLPEAHTDFVFSVLAEELGLFGAIGVVVLFAILIYRAFVIGRKAEISKRFFSAFICYGVALNLAVQAYINLAVNTGLLPTKGLTLPLMSYGGSSLLISGIMVGLLLCVDKNNRLLAQNTDHIHRQHLAKHSSQAMRDLS